MKTIKIAAWILLFSVSALALKSLMPVLHSSKKAPLTYTVNDDYKKLWIKADSLVNAGLTRSALDVVKIIYDKAKAENHTGNYVKAVVYRLKLQSYISEEDYIQEINALNTEVAEAKFPAKPVLHSMLAEVYWRYYQNNRYKFMNRTETVNFVPEDIRTWDLRKIVEKVIEHYMVSLQDADQLKKTSINVYDDIMVKQTSDGARLRPTLFDFLAHRAIDYFMNEEPGLVTPANKFEINSPEFLGTYDQFIAAKISTEDSFSLPYHGSLLMQQLLAFHKNDVNPEVLIDVDLKRLRYFYKKSVIPEKDTLYVSALEALEKKFSSFPCSSEASYERALYYSAQGNTYKANSNESPRWLLKKALDICNKTIDKFPDAYGSSQCKYLASVINEKNMILQTEEVNSPLQPFLGLLKYKNINEVFVRIVKVDYNWYVKSQQDRYEYEKIIKQYVKLSYLKQFNVALTNPGDFQLHSTEIKLPELDMGFYLILVSNNSDFSYDKQAVCYSTTWISDIAYMKRTLENGQVQFVVTNRRTGAPLKGIGAQVYSQEYSYISRSYEYIKSEYLISDENGMFKSTPLKNHYYNYYVDFKLNKDQLVSDPFYQYGSYYKNDKAYLKTVYFTDRAIYRPGQTVNFKGILLEQEGEKSSIKTGQNVHVEFYDVNYQKIAEKDFVTNDYGTFSGQFTIPQGLLNGQMHLGDTWGNVYFSVEEYKRPKFEVEFQPMKGTYRLNETVKATGIAKSYSGANIDNAVVKYRVVRTASFPYWWYRWYGYYPTSPQMEIANGTVKTNENGEYTIEFKAIPDKQISKKSNPTFNYEIIADVTDNNGETQSDRTSVRVGYQALVVGVDLPASLNKNDKEPFVISTTNLSGNYEYAKGNIKIYHLKQPDRLMRPRLWEMQDLPVISKENYYSWFPNDVYKNEDNSSEWAKESEVLNINFDTKKDSLLDLKSKANWASGQYLLEITSTDNYGEKVESFSNFTLFGESDKSIPVNAYNWFTVLKGSGEPGETASFLMGSKASNVNVLMETEVKNSIVSKQWITINNEMKKIDVPILENYRGNFTVHFTFVINGRVYSNEYTVNVPYTNKELDITYETFRSKLTPGQKEEWKIKIKGKNGQKVAAEMLASMYDASLDAFRKNSWDLSLYQSYYSQRSWEENDGFSTNNSILYSIGWNQYSYVTARLYDYLNWFGYQSYYGYGGNYYDYRWDDNGMNGEYAEYDQVMAVSETTVATGATKNGGGKNKESAKKGIAYTSRVADVASAEEKVAFGGTPAQYGDETGGIYSLDGEMGNIRGNQKDQGNIANIKARSNFSETAFFYPHLQTDANGEITISFTVPESLTKWKFMALAHTKDLMCGETVKEIITQKDLMVVPNAPRFFRENDKITFMAKIVNLSNDSVNGHAALMLFDAETDKPIDVQFSNLDQSKCFNLGKGRSASVEWDLIIPEGVSVVKYKVVATTDHFSDGEEAMIPVLTNKMLVTETMPLPIRGNQTKNFNFQKLIDSYKSNTLRQHKLTLEYTGNPSWYAVQALPYLIEYPYECIEQIFSRFYANSIAMHIVNSNPKIKAVFDEWKKETPEALTSNLEKNQDLKYLLLQETPWVLDAKNETKSKQNIAILFDTERMNAEIDKALRKIERAQLPNGGWTWFAGMPDDRYITQYLITGFCHLDKLGVRDVKEKQRVWNMVKRGSRYLDDRITDDYNWILKYTPETINENHIGYLQIQYLYARSYFVKDLPIEAKNKKAFDYYVGQAKKYWLQNSRYMQGMIALGLNRLGDKTTALGIVKSLKENAIFNDEMGMYWKENSGGYYWYEAPVETQALLIECFDEVANDLTSVEEMKIWLLKQKQTQNWKSTKSTAEACYALLLRGSDWLANDPKVSVTLGNLLVDPAKATDSKQQAGTGYFRTSWWQDAVTPDMGKINVKKESDGIAWGAVYWQYFEQLDKITAAETPLKIVKQLFVEKYSNHGPIIEPITSDTKLKLGDKIKVRIEIRVDRAMEYVHMKDMRAAGFEPINVISTYKYQGGLGYYESTGDAATNFFISYLPKGTFVFEYPLRVAQKGDFSNGVTTIQCMYAPEFTSHSEGIRVKVSG